MIIVGYQINADRDSLAKLTPVEYNTYLMIQVTRKDGKESLENLLRRFNRKVQQSGSIAIVKSKQNFEKPISKVERRKKAIIRQERRALKVKRTKLGQR